MKNKIIIFCVLSVVGFWMFPVVSHASVNPVLVRILNYYADSDGRVTFKWQQYYDGCNASGFDCSGGVQLSIAQFPSNGGEGFYNTDTDFGSNKGFMNFTTTCNELTATGRICISHPKILKNRNNNDIIASNSSGLLYADVASYVNSGGQMHTIVGGIFRVINDENYRPSATNHFSFGDVELPYAPPFTERNPILIVPGLVGTEIYKESEELWLDLARNFTDIGDNFMDPLGFRSDLTSDIDLNVRNVIDKEMINIGVGKILIFDYTDGLITELENQGYIENPSVGSGQVQNLFTFPYDWRYGVSGKYPDEKTNADLLQQKIQDILAQTGSATVDVVAHSQGGLIVKKYVVDHPTDHSINKAVFVGVPNTGAPEAIKVLLQGDNFGIPWLSQNEMKKLAENMPAAYDLLPSQQYYNTKGSFVKVIDDGEFDNFNDYTQKDLNYQDFGDFLTNDHSLNTTALTQAETLHTQSFDDFDLRTAGVDLYAIDGCKAGTIGTITENRFENILGQHFVEYKTPKFIPGDGTVPLESATNLPINPDQKFYSLIGEHSKMLSQDGSRQEIVNLLTGSSLEVKEKFMSQDIAKCNLNGKAISVFSPIDIFVTDQDGSHLGNADDGSMVSEIPNAAFEVLGDHKFLYLPTDENQTYTIAIKGTGVGTYTITSQDIADNQITSTEVFSNLSVTTQLSGQINLGNASQPTTLLVQQTPSDPFFIIVPSANIDANQSQDILPSISIATVTGTKGQADFYRSDVTVSLSVVDQVIEEKELQTSGVLDITYLVDNEPVQKANNDAVQIIILSEGTHTITFFSTDKAGNNEQEEIITFTIDKTIPEIIMTTPIDGGSYTLGQLVFTNWSTSDSLSGIASAVGTVSSGSPIDTLSVGTKSFNVTVSDTAGNIVEKNVSYRVVYAFEGPGSLTTISKTDFKKMSTIPIKFRLKDAIGNYVNNAIATLKVNGVNAVSSGGANIANIFKYDLANQQYIFNLSTKSLLLSTNNLVINLDDGTSYSRTIIIK